MENRIVLHMKDRRPVWTMPGWVAGEIREVLPPEWEVVSLDAPADGSGDGAALVSEAVLESVREARVYMGMGIAEEVLQVGRDLEWVHSGAAGVAGSLTPTMRERDVVFTNSAGIHGPPMAETVLAMILHFLRGLDFAIEGMSRAEWWTEPFDAADSPVTELSDCIVGILGYGGVGREVARRIAPFGPRILALRRHPPDGSDPHARVLHGKAGFERILGRSDILVVTLPETPETRNLLDDEALERMKRGGVLVNVARAGVVDHDALLRVLRSGRLRGAAVDVVPHEPLQEDHPLWDAPNLVITPHVSAVTPVFWRRQTDLIRDNLERFLEGRPLLNVVDKDAGY